MRSAFSKKNIIKVALDLKLYCYDSMHVLKFCKSSGEKICYNFLIPNWKTKTCYLHIENFILIIITNR